MSDETERFLRSLPEVAPGEKFCFACHPEVRCFNACCGDLNLVLTPYDVLRLRRALGMGGRDFVERYGIVGQAPDTGFPVVHLKMGEDVNRSCPFVSAAGCTVYGDRPGACRTYPIGRAARMGEGGEPVEQFFLVREPHCMGFEETREWTVETWTKDQGLEEYNANNDRYMRLMARQKERGGGLNQNHVNMAWLALYQVDAFQQFVRDMGLFARVSVSREQEEQVLSDEEACLEFGLDWVELIVFGDNANLSPK